MQFSCSVDVTVTSPNFIDMDIFDLWIEDGTVIQTCKIIKKSKLAEEFNLSTDMIASHVRDHFAQFSLLEIGLRHPDLFMQDYCTYNHQLSKEIRKTLIYKYYSLDESFVRELVGRRLSNKSRRDLTEISDRLDLNLHSCKRQFDNLLFVARRTEDLPGSLFDNIKNYFVLPTELAERYTAFVFITNNRFETSKKSLAYVTFSDLAYCAGQLMEYWSTIVKDAKNDNLISVELDLQLFNDFKVLKPLIDKKEYLDKHKTLVIQDLFELNATNILINLESHFKSISKVIINLACGLTHAREMRDFFLDIVEKLLEPIRNLNWSYEEFQLFLKVYSNTAKWLPVSRSAQFNRIWTRFIYPFSNCVLHLYHN